jgi:hypothetical protein
MSDPNLVAMKGLTEAEVVWLNDVASDAALAAYEVAHQRHPGGEDLVFHAMAVHFVRTALLMNPDFAEVFNEALEIPPWRLVRES